MRYYTGKHETEKSIMNRNTSGFVSELAEKNKNSRSSQTKDFKEPKKKNHRTIKAKTHRYDTPQILIK